MPLVKDVGKPDEGEPHVRIDGGALETGQPNEPSAGPRSVCWKTPPRWPGRGPACRHLPPRQRSTLHGRFCRSRMYPTLWHINTYLVRWAMRKFKRLRGKTLRAWAWLEAVRQHQPTLFAHWHLVGRVTHVGLWEPGEGRPSRRVLWGEPRGAIPPGHSPEAPARQALAERDPHDGVGKGHGEGGDERNERGPWPVAQWQHRGDGERGDDRQQAAATRPRFEKNARAQVAAVVSTATGGRVGSGRPGPAIAWAVTARPRRVTWAP
jgi:hypothetical protein